MRKENINCVDIYRRGVYVDEVSVCNWIYCIKLLPTSEVYALTVLHTSQIAVGHTTPFESITVFIAWYRLPTADIPAPKLSSASGTSF
jgi:hypothetical protein